MGRRRSVLSAGLLCVALLWPGVVLGRTPTSEELRRDAEQAEAKGDWRRACALYEQLPARERSQAETRKRYLACVRNVQRQDRHRDPSYQQQAGQLTLTHALIVYEEVLGRLQDTYADRTQADIGRLFKHGVEELNQSLNDPEFCRTFVAAGTGAVREFLSQVAAPWAERKVRRAREAALEAGLLAQAAEESLGIQPVLVVLELASGACNALDEYTLYLSPGRFQELNTSLRGEVVSIGIDVVVGDAKLVIRQVLPGSPAEMAGLRPGDFVLRLAGRAAQGLNALAVAELLAGELGTMLELDVQGRDETDVRSLMLPRQLVRVPSVAVQRFADMDSSGIAYVQLTAFHETTPQEMDAALRDLQAAGMKALVLDLRGNPGGLFPAALEIVKRFVADGTITSTRGQLRDFNQKHDANSGDALTLPLVVLVDGGTASMAELVAGALKENGRATLVGQPTFGKGVIQRIRPLTSTSPGQQAAGLQVTVARFFSPRGRTYEGKGVQPDHVVGRTPPESAMDMSQDMQLTVAVEKARELALGR